MDAENIRNNMTGSLDRLWHHCGCFHSPFFPFIHLLLRHDSIDHTVGAAAKVMTCASSSVERTNRNWDVRSLGDYLIRSS
jgi:hypothetical protein